jgi:predicted nucleic acid-binding protein
MPPANSLPDEIVSNTGPLITLERLPSSYDLMRQLYRRILIPPQVLAELAAGLPTTTNYLEYHHIQDFIAVEAAPDPAPQLARLDEGERYAIALASARRLPLLIEDKLGRQLATREGLIISGIAGQILTAYYRGLLTAAAAREQFQHLYEVRRINHRLWQQLIESL